MHFINLSCICFFNVHSKEFIVLQSTTSARDSGLYDFILPKFDQTSGVEVRVVAVGTGQAIKNLEGVMLMCALLLTTRNLRKDLYLMGMDYKERNLCIMILF